MTRRLLIWTIPTLLAGCQAADAVGTGSGENHRDSAVSTADGGNESSDETVVSISTERITPVPSDQLPQTEAEWKERLTDDQYYVLREHGTERANSGEYTHTKTKGTYYCAGCGEPLFDSETKFDSGTGWPSFYDVLGEVGDHVGTQEDRSWFTTRTEVHCRRCGGHLGHVFEDGPAPTGLRYCINSVSLKLGQPVAEERTPAEDSDAQSDSDK